MTKNHTKHYFYLFLIVLAACGAYRFLANEMYGQSTVTAPTETIINQ
ncbi:hypothetical protein OAP63_17000 [Vibrio sp.]|nr:hypothetical protein [Vibrio sp.]